MIGRLDYSEPSDHLCAETFRNNRHSIRIATEFWLPPTLMGHPPRHKRVSVAGHYVPDLTSVCVQLPIALGQSLIRRRYRKRRQQLLCSVSRPFQSDNLLSQFAPKFTAAALANDRDRPAATQSASRRGLCRPQYRQALRARLSALRETRRRRP